MERPFGEPLAALASRWEHEYARDKHGIELRLECDMYVLIVIFFQGGSTSPNAGFTQEFATREACHHAMNETKKAIQSVGRDRLVMQCVSKDRPQS